MSAVYSYSVLGTRYSVLGTRYLVLGLETLRTDAQFERVRREGRSWGTPLLVLNAARNGTDTIRCGFITGKKVGKAVQRNRARRLIRETVRLRLPLLQPGWDLVWIARAGIAKADYGAVAGAVEESLRRARLLRPGASFPLPLATAGEQSRIIGEEITDPRQSSEQLPSLEP